jgi:hypothetical protein
MRYFGAVALALYVTLGAASWAQAHHSLAGFDRTKTVTIKGVVKQFDWTNPHVYITVVEPPSGSVPKVWSLEGGATGIMVRKGWTFKSLKPGDEVTAAFYRLKDGRDGGFLIMITKADGKTLS